MRLIIITLLLNINFVFSQIIKEPYKAINTKILKLYKSKKYKKANDLLDLTLNDVGLDEETKKTFLYNKYKISKKLLAWDDAIVSLQKVIDLGGLKKDAYSKYYHRYDLAKLHIKNKENTLACEELKIIGDYNYTYNGRYSERHNLALALKDSLCGDYLANKEFEEKKAINPNYGNQVPVYSLLKMTESDIQKKIGSPTGTILEHKDKNSYTANVYKSEYGEYRIAFKNGTAFLIWYYPSVQQTFKENDLWTGGKFDVENKYLNGGIGTSSKGFFNGISYFSIDYSYNDFEKHSITFYGKENEHVTKILVF